MKKNIDHDSRDSKRGDFYQSLVAVLYAISEPKLKKFETLVIEHKGDVSFDNLIQLEMKHHKSKHSLSDTSEEFWKTLYNWLKQNDYFESLILHTTSHFPVRGMSELKKWNKSTVDDRIIILNNIKFNYNLEEISQYKISKINLEILQNLNVPVSTIDVLLKFPNNKFTRIELEELLTDSICSKDEISLILQECKDTSLSKYKIWNYLRFVESYNKEKLRNIISIITIDASQKNDINTIIEISESPVFLNVCKSENDFDILIREKIAGAIASKVAGEKKWQVSQEQFYNILNEAKSLFYKNNYRPIFDKYLSHDPSEEQISEHSKKNFLKELKQICCESDEIKEATVDYWKTNSLIAEELDSNPLFVLEEYVPYKEKIIKPKLVNGKRKCDNNGNEQENLKTSLRFYRDAKDLFFYDYLGIRSLPYFTHGTMNNIVEDDNNDFNWIIND